MPEPFTESEMLRLSGAAMAKIDTHGRRGTSHVTYDEIEAMAALLDIAGLGHAARLAHANPLTGDLT